MDTGTGRLHILCDSAVSLLITSVIYRKGIKLTANIIQGSTKYLHASPTYIFSSISIIPQNSIMQEVRPAVSGATYARIASIHIIVRYTTIPLHSVRITGRDVIRDFLYGEDSTNSEPHTVPIS